MNPDRRSALLLLALALLGTGVRLVLGEHGAPGALAYHPIPARSAHGIAGRDSLARDSLVARALRLARPLRDGERIDVDVASVEELARLPRVGPGLAARIAAERDAHGPFGSIEGLGRRVAGAGQSLRTAILPHAVFSGVPRGAGAGIVLRDGERSLVGASDDAPGDSDPLTPVPVNSAGAADLARLPGVGPRLAAQIVAYRTTHGPFSTLQDLRKVRGVGPSLLKRLDARIRVP